MLQQFINEYSFSNLGAGLNHSWLITPFGAIELLNVTRATLVVVMIIRLVNVTRVTVPSEL
jgi:hypothetical protein